MVALFWRAQIVVDLQEALHQIAGVDVGAGECSARSSARRAAGMHRRSRCATWRTVSGTAGARLGGRLIAGRVAREHGDRRVEVLIVAQCEERDAGRGILDAKRRAGERGKAHIADSDTGGHVGRRRTKHDELGAAMIDEMMERQHADARRLESNLEIARDVGLASVAVHRGPAACAG